MPVVRFVILWKHQPSEARVNAQELKEVGGYSESLKAIGSFGAC